MAPGGMDDLADEAGDEADKALADEELKLLASTTLDLANLRPKVTDQETFDKLFGPVATATASNLRLAHLRSRLRDLGSQGLRVAREVLAILSKAT